MQEYDVDDPQLEVYTVKRLQLISIDTSSRHTLTTITELATPERMTEGRLKSV